MREHTRWFVPVLLAVTGLAACGSTDHEVVTGTAGSSSGETPGNSPDCAADGSAQSSSTIDWVHFDSYEAMAQASSAIMHATVTDDLGAGVNTGGLPPVDPKTGAAQPALPMQFVKVRVTEPAMQESASLTVGTPVAGNASDDAALRLCPGDDVVLFAHRETKDSAPGVFLGDGTQLDDWWSVVGGPYAVMDVRDGHVIARRPLDGHAADLGPTAAVLSLRS